jgi:hypothetical protein
MLINKLPVEITFLAHEMTPILPVCPSRLLTFFLYSTELINYLPSQMSRTPSEVPTAI